MKTALAAAEAKASKAEAEASRAEARATEAGARAAVAVARVCNAEAEIAFLKLTIKKLQRERVLVPEPTACACCGSEKLSKIGEVTQMSDSLGPPEATCGATSRTFVRPPKPAPACRR